MSSTENSVFTGSRDIDARMRHVLSDMATELVEINGSVAGFDAESGEWILHEQNECIDAARGPLKNRLHWKRNNALQGIFRKPARVTLGAAEAEL